MGLGKESNTVYITDFRFTKKYTNIDMITDLMSYQDENKNYNGSAKYASANTLMGIEQSRRDDLESLGFVLVYLNSGSLPWQGMKATTKRQKHEKILESRISMSIDELCQGYPGNYLFNFLLFFLIYQLFFSLLIIFLIFNILPFDF